MCVCACVYASANMQKSEGGMGGGSVGCGSFLFVLTYAHSTIHGSARMGVLLLFTHRLSFLWGLFCSYATSGSSQCVSRLYDTRIHRILCKTMMFACISCPVNNEHVSSFSLAQMVPSQP